MKVRKYDHVQYPRVMCVYKLVLPGGQVYVGATEDLRERCRKHRWLLESGKHHNSKLQKLVKKWADVKVEIVTKHRSPAAMLKMEKIVTDEVPANLLLNYRSGFKLVEGFHPRTCGKNPRFDAKYVPAKKRGKITKPRWFDHLKV